MAVLLAFAVLAAGSPALAQSGTVPDAPTGLTATPGDGQVSLSWTAGDDGGSTIIKHQYQQYQGGIAGPWTDIPDSGAGGTNAAGYTVEDLTSGPYHFRVRAVNAIGEGHASGWEADTPNLMPEVWSATLAVQDLGGWGLGCDYAPTIDKPCSQSSILTDDDFTYDNVDYAVMSLGLTSRLEIGVDNRITSNARNKLTLHVDGAAFAFKDADSDTNSYRRRWSSTGLSWSEGGSVSLRITGPPTAPGSPTDLAATAGDRQATLSWTAGDDGHNPITKHQYQRMDVSGQFGSWTDIPDSGVSGANAASYTVTGLNATPHKFRVRAANAIGNGAASNEALVTSIVVREVWSATLTVQDLGNNQLGCDNDSSSGRHCNESSGLTNNGFTYEETAYAVTHLVLSAATGNLSIVVDQSITPSSDNDFILHVDGAAFPFEDADTKSSTGWAWNNSGLSWSADSSVSLSITTPVTAAELPMNGSVSGTLNPEGDIDYFRVEITEPDGQYVLIKKDNYRNGEGDNFIYLTLWKEDGSCAVRECEAPVEGRYHWYFLEPGTYFLRAVANDEQDDVSQVYSISLEPFTWLHDEIERCSAIETDFDDPLFGCQWHLHNTGQYRSDLTDIGALDINVMPAWNDGYMGQGINVAIVDNGMDFEHEDLRDNVDRGRNHDYRGMGTVFDPNEDHGTQMAGIIAARDNSVGGVGVAPRATIYSYNCLNNLIGRCSQEPDALTRNLADTAVSNHSYGSLFDPEGGHSRAAASWEEAVETGIRDGFGGKGIVYVTGSGNHGWAYNYHTNLDEQKNFYAFMTVGATNSHGIRQSYSNQGYSLWLSAPVWSLNTGNYDTYTMTEGTSMASAVVSGVAALVRSANTNLTWRDVKLILAASAQKNDPDNSSWEDGALKYGSETDRYNYNPEYGFGVVDAGEAVALAKQWANLPPMKTASADTGDKRNQFLIADRPESGRLIPTVLQLTLGPEVGFAEFVEVRLDGIFREFRDLRIELESPSGTVSVLGTPSESPGSRDMDFIAEGIRWGSARHLGEDPTGVWTLKITDEVGGSNDRSGTIHGWSIKVYGHGEGQEPTPPKYTKVPDTPQTPTVVAIHDGIVDLEWNNLPETESYEVQFYDYGWLDLPGRGIEIALYGAGAVVRNLDPDGWYPFHVRAKNPLGTSDWSDIAYFQGTGSQDWNGVPEPTNSPATGAPTISGTPQVGEVLTASVEDIEDANGLNRVKFSYQWIRSNGSTDTDIEGATDAAYTLTDGDEGKTIKVRVSFTDRGGYAESLTSAATAAVTNNAPASNTPATGLPTLGGTAQVGETLTAETRDIEDDDGLDNAVFTYQWLANGADIAGATDPTYTPVDDDAGLTIKVQVSFFDDKNNPETLTSAATTAVLANVPDTPEHLNVSLHDTGALDVSWEAPSSDGGSAITEYRVQWKETAGNWDTPADVTEETATGTTHTITALTDGVEYAVRVIAVNDVGDGPPSGEATGTPRETTPPVLTKASVRSLNLGTQPEAAKANSGDEPVLVGSVTVVVTQDNSDPDNVITSFAVTWRDYKDCASEYNAYFATHLYGVPVIGGGTYLEGFQIHLGSAASADSEIAKSLSNVQDTSPGFGFEVKVYCGTFESESGRGVSFVYVPQGILHRPQPGTHSSEPGLTALTVNPGTLSPEFHNHTVEYTVGDVPNANDMITVTTAVKTGLTVGIIPWDARPIFWLCSPGAGGWSWSCSEPYEDEDILPDADVDAPGYQLALEEGDNHFAVFVWNADEDARLEFTTYILTVTRAAMTPLQTRSEESSRDTGVLNRGSRYLSLDVGTAEETASPDLTLIVAGTFLTLTYDEALDEDSVPATGAFTVAVSGTAAEVSHVSVSGSAVTLMLASAVTAEDTATVSYAAPTDAAAPRIQDDAGNPAASFSDQDVENNTPPPANTPATGAPTIGGTAHVGETLTVDTTAISDADGLDNVGYSYQWLADNTEIAGATDPTYTLVAADEDKTIKVRVTFTDDGGNQETLTSAATAAVDPDPGPITGFTVVDASDQSVEGALADGGTLALDDPDGGSYGIRADLESGATIGSMRLHITGAKTHDQTENIAPYSLYGDSGGNLSGESLPVGEYTLTATAYSEARLGGNVLGTVKVSFSVTETATQQPNSPATGAPSISGTARVGETLTVDTSGIDDADGIGNATFSYQWIAGTTDISGATGSSYAPLVADLGKAIKVRVSFTDGASNVETLTSEATAAVAAKPNTPATGLPTISGTAQVGETLTVDTSGIDDADGMSGAVFSYQWLANEVNIDTEIVGATDPTYTLVADDVGKAIRVRVSFDDDLNFLETLTSAATATVVTPLTAEFQDVPDKHDGTGFFTFLIAFSEPISISYKTLRDDSLEVTNGSATKAKRVDGQSDLWEITVEPDSDADVTVVLPVTGDCTAQDAVCTRDGTKLSNRSELTVPGPAAANSPATGAPIISGTAQVGKTLTVDTSGIDDADGMSGAVFSYQWLANDAEITGATGDTYTLVEADFDKAVKVRVIFNDDEANEETLTSEPTAAVTAKPNSPATGAPTISGTVRVGEVLTAHTSYIDDADGMDNAEFGFNWWAAEGYLRVTGVNKTYRVQSRDVGLTISVSAGFMDDAGNLEILSSAETGAVAPTTPAPPQNLNVSHHGTGALDLSWEAPTSDLIGEINGKGTHGDGGSPITGYKVQWKSGSEDYDGSAGSTRQAEITDPASRTHTITGLTDGVEYAVRVIAVNDVGDGPPSDEATGTPRETTPPELSTATVDGTTLTLTYDEALDEASGLAVDAFSVTVGGTGRAVDGVSVSGSSVILTLGSVVASGATVTVSYTVPTDAAAPRIQDEAGNPAASFSDQGVENNTPPPANTPATGAPSISGTVRVGETLTVDTSGIDDDDGLDNAVFTYQWLANGADITGATSDTYTLADDDGGKTIKVRVSFRDDRGHQETRTSDPTAAVETRPNSPATGAPTISGTVRVGETLTTETSAIADADGMSKAVFIYQWLADDADIAGATSDTYTLVADDVDKAIKVRVIFTDDKNNPETLTSAATAGVEPRPNSPATGAPSISGTAQVGETLTVDTSGIDDADGMSGAVFSYQWLANGADIAGATSDTYTPVADDVGKAIKVRVSFRDDRNHQESLTSAATAAVTAAADESSIWSATLTVGSIGGFRGFWKDVGMGELTSEVFTLDGVDYTVKVLADSDGPQFYLTLDKALLVGFTLQVGATTLSSQDASIREFSSGATQYGWATNQEAILADVDTVEVSLTLDE